MIGLWLGLVLAAAPAVPAQAGTDAVAPSRETVSDCPPARTYQPRYPADMARRNRTGTAIVEARVDACGRVLEVRLADSAGWPQLNTAALEAVAGFVVPAKTVAGAVDGWVKVPIRFGGIRSVTAKKIDWPRSHRRPVYVLDDTSTGFATIAEFTEAAVEDKIAFLEPPYVMVRDVSGNYISTTLYPDRESAMTYWFTYRVQPPVPADPAKRVDVQAIARYRLTEEDGRPVVRLAILCERPAEECALLGKFLMAGLPFAKPR